MSPAPLLLVLGGRPGTGKSTIARRVAQALRATWVRIDSIEGALARVGLRLGDVPAAYEVAHAVAADQLRSGRPVVVDAVHPVRESRSAWTSVAADTGAALRWVEVRCPDPDEHRRRVESRVADVAGHAVPTWAQVQARAHDDWDEQRLVLDNDGTIDVAAGRVLTWLAKGGFHDLRPSP